MARKQGKGGSSKLKAEFIRDKAEALIQALAEGNTVTELAADCGVAFGTFVKHLKAVVGVAEWKRMVPLGRKPAQAVEKAPGVAQGERSDEIGAVGRQVQQKGASDIEAQQAIDNLRQGDRVIRQCFWCSAEVEGDVTRCSKCGSLGPFEKVTLMVI